MNEIPRKKKKWFKRKKVLIPLTLIIILVAGRIYLPYYVRDELNKTLADIPGYYGHIDDVGISLYRGAYQLNGLYLDKVDSKTQTPFLNFPKTDISIQWGGALLDGRVVSEIEMQHPSISYTFEDHIAADGSLDEPSADIWYAVLTDIVPLQINRFETIDGEFTFTGLYAEPNIDLYLSNVNALATNLQNAEQSSLALPSTLKATATTIGNGILDLNGKLDLIKEIPDMNLDMTIKNADITALNDLTLHYAGIDFEEGKFELASELAIADGYMKGYFKPLMTDTKIVDKWSDEDTNIFKIAWESFVGLFKFVLKNQGTDTLATNIPIEGSVENTEIGIWSSVFNIFENGWFNAFDSNVDDTIGFNDAITKKNDSAEARKEARRLRREERRIERVTNRAQRRNSNDNPDDNIDLEYEIEQIKSDT